VAINATQNKIQSTAFCLALSIAVCLSICFAIHCVEPEQLCETSIDSQINPNSAPLASLIRLPGIGIVRAGAIIAYRKDFSETNYDRAAFQNCEDLQKVKGIGPKTTESICEWLKFE